VVEGDWMSPQKRADVVEERKLRYGGRERRRDGSGRKGRLLRLGLVFL